MRRWLAHAMLALAACSPARRATPHDAGDATHACDPPPVCPDGLSADDAPEPSAWPALRAMLHGPDDAIDLAEVNLRIAQMWNPAVDLRDGLSRVDAIAASVRAVLPARCDPRCRLDALRRYLFETMHLRAEVDPSGMYRNMRRVLIASVIDDGAGYCEGLAYLMVAVGARLGVPLAVVPERQHVNVRFEDAGGRVLDLDPTRGGARAEPTPASSCRAADGVFGAPMRRSEVAGMMLGALAGRAAGMRRPWLDDAVSLAPRSPQVRNNRGVEREGRMDPAGALEDYLASYALDPCVPFPLANAARVQARLGRHAEATATLARLAALVSTRGDAEGEVSLALAEAEIAVERDDDAAADSAFLRALRAAPGTWATAAQVARARQAQGRYREAADAWRTASLESDDPSMRLAWIEALVEAHDVATAAGALADLEHERPSLPPWVLARAMVYAATGHTDRARDAARECLAHQGLGCARGLLALANASRAARDSACAAQYDAAFVRCRWPVASRRIRTLQREASGR